MISNDDVALTTVMFDAHDTALIEAVIVPVVPTGEEIPTKAPVGVWFQNTPWRLLSAQLTVDPQDICVLFWS